MLEETFCWRDDQQVRWSRHGSGPPVVLCHGTPWSSALWAPVADALSSDFTVYLWDMPGYGTYPFPDTVEGLPPTLTISIIGDPTTPYDPGVSLAEALGGSMLTVEGEQHTIAATGANACVDDIVADYLITGTTPPDDARCTL